MGRRFSRILIQLFGLGIAVLLFVINYSDRMVQIRALPDTLYLTDESGRVGSLFDDAGGEGVAAVDVQQAERLSDVLEDGEAYTFRFLGVIPLRTVQVCAPMRHI